MAVYAEQWPLCNVHIPIPITPKLQPMYRIVLLQFLWVSASHHRLLPFSNSRSPIRHARFQPLAKCLMTVIITRVFSVVRPLRQSVEDYGVDPSIGLYEDGIERVDAHVPICPGE